MMPVPATQPVILTTTLTFPSGEHGDSENFGSENESDGMTASEAGSRKMVPTIALEFLCVARICSIDLGRLSI